MTKRKLSVEDDSLWQTFMAAALRAVPEVAQVVFASTGAEACALARTLRPDVALLDLVLPDTDGIALARELVRSPRPPRVVFVTTRRDAFVLHAASECHIAGLIWEIWRHRAPTGSRDRYHRARRKILPD